MKKSLLMLTFTWALALPLPSFAATDPCAGQKTAAKTAEKTLAKAEKSRDKLSGKLGAKIDKYRAKQENYDNKILNCRSQAQGLDVKLSECNAISGFVGLIWDDSTATSASCQASNTIIGGIVDVAFNALKCLGECTLAGLFGADQTQCESNCHKKDGDVARCRKRATQVCTSIVKWRVKAEGYERQKATYNPACSGVALQDCPSGILRPLYVGLHGADGTDQTSGAIFNASHAQTAKDAADAALLACQTPH